MLSLFLNRVYRSVKIDPDVFNEVQKDKNATLSAAIVVLLSSLAPIPAAKLDSRTTIAADKVAFLSFCTSLKTSGSILTDR